MTLTNRPEYTMNILNEGVDDEIEEQKDLKTSMLRSSMMTSRKSLLLI